VNGLAQLGFILLERDRMAEAETALRRAIAINNKHFYANYDLGRLLVKSHRYDQAVPILLHAVMLKPNNASVHYQLFLALSRLKRKAEADGELTTFKKLDEARKARPRSESDVEEDDLQNPAAAPAVSPPPNGSRSEPTATAGGSDRTAKKRMDDQSPIRLQRELRSSSDPESLLLCPTVL